MNRNHKTNTLIDPFSDEFYLAVESSFEEITEHTLFLANYIINTFHPNPEKDSFLDIGCGPAFVSKKLSNHFLSITGIDPNKTYVPYYKELNKRTNFNYIIDTFEDCKIIPMHSYILCSHALYHIPQCEWKIFILKALSLLEVSGKALITLVSSTGAFHSLCYSINNKYSNSSVLCNILDELNIPYERQPVTSEYVEKSREKYSHLIRLFAITDCYQPHEYNQLSDSEKNRIEILLDAFIDQTYCKNIAAYKLITEEEYIIISK